jgi:hypothetical protein
MDIGQISLPVMVVAIVFGAKTVRQFIASSERRFEMRMNAQHADTESDRAGIKALRDEFAAFRDTVTQYDLTVEDKFKRMEDRMAWLEQRSLGTRTAAPAAGSEPQQIVGIRE